MSTARSSGAIEAGLLVYLGAGKGDSAETANWMALKLAGLRIFEDAGRQDEPLRSRTSAGSVLVVSQFTLYGDVRKGRRPSFDARRAPRAGAALSTRRSCARTARARAHRWRRVVSAPTWTCAPRWTAR